MILLSAAATIKLDYIGNKKESSENMSFGWTYQTGEMVDLFFPKVGDVPITIQKKVTAEEISGRSLCFEVKNLVFDVYLDKELIYDFHPKLKFIEGDLYGDFNAFVSVPYFEGEKNLKIIYRPIFKDKMAGFYNMEVEYSGKYITRLLSRDIPKLALCLSTFLFGFALFIFGSIERLLKHNMLETTSLGTICMLLSVWAAPKVNILLMLTGNPASSRTLDYITLVILPIPILIFVASITKFNNRLILNGFLMLSGMNVVLHMCLVFTKILDYTDLTFVSHILISVNVIFVIHMLTVAIRENTIDKNQQYYVITAISAIGFGGTVDMLRYYTSLRTTDTSLFSRYALVIFIIILAVYEFRQLVDMQVKSGNAEILKHMAMEDSLTGLFNRTAFNEYERELMKRKKGTVLFIHFDVNFLKKVNDTYGHAEGDRHIIAASKALVTSFGDYGNCYRVGGDEFFVVIEGKNALENYEKGLEKFMEFQENYNALENPMVPLEMAYGMAEYDCADKNPEKAEKLADSRMYEKKKLMKADKMKKNIDRISPVDINRNFEKFVEQQIKNLPK